MPIAEYPAKTPRGFAANAVVRVSGPMAVLDLALGNGKIGEPLITGEHIPSDLGSSAMPPEALGDDDDYFDEEDESEEIFRLISALGEKATVKEAEYYVSEASLVSHDGMLTLIYPEIDGESESYTEISFSFEQPDVISIVHTGKQPYIFVIEEDVRHVCIANGGNAPEMIVVGKSVKNGITRDGGELKLEFSIESPLIPRATASINYIVNLTEAE